MGATLSTRAQWSSGGAKLDFSPRNESLLRDLDDYVSTLVSQHAREAGVTFKRPFEWKSKLRTNDFESLKSSDAYTTSDTSIVSTATTSLGEPLLRISHTGSGSDVRAWTFAELNIVLRCAGDRSIGEIQACLESNRDPMANIVGVGYGTSDSGGESALLETHERLVRERMRDGGDAANVEDLDNSFRLLLLLESLDVKLLQSSVKEIGKSVRLSADAVENEVNLLKEFAGHDQQSCLRQIEFTSSYRFGNGCRAPPWRQVHGDIAYLHIKPVDTDPRHVTANAAGYYTNKGLKPDGEIDYETTSEIYSSLVGLLKTISHHFAQNIMNQEYRYKGDNEDQADGGRGLVSSDGAVKAGDAQREAERATVKEKKAETSKASESHVRGKKAGGKGKSGKKGLSQQQEFNLGPRSREPTQKWKNLTTVAEVPTKPAPPKSLFDRKGSAPKKSQGRSRVAESVLRSQTDDLYVSESSSDDEEEEDVAERRQETSDLPAEYWQIQKLVRYLKGGNQTATVIALCSMRDFDLTQETCQMAIRDVGGLEVLINLLETSDVRCKIGSLKILRDVSRNASIRTSIADLEGLETMVKMLEVPNKELKCLAAETIANVAKFRRARRTVRQYGGIKKLVDLLQQPVVDKPEEDLDVAMARSGALALWSCSKSTKNKQSIYKAGAVPLLARLLKCSNESVLVPVVGTLQECASEFIYRQMIRTEGMIEDLVKNLGSASEELKMHCASAIFKCAEDEESRDLVRKFDGLGPLVKLLKNSSNKDLLAAATGAIWKCAVSVANVQVFQKLDAVDSLVTLLHNQPEEVLINVVGALGECAKVNANRTVIRKKQGIGPLVGLLTGTNHPLLINVTKAVGACANDLECMTIIDQNDGVRLLWSLLKSPNPAVQSSAAWAICPCIENAKDAGEMVRSFVGGLELIVGLLKSDDEEVLASVCAAIANIAKDEENLAVITDHGVVALLAKLTTTSEGHLRKHLAEAIARCCTWGNNRVAFGVNGAVAPLVGYLSSKLAEVHCATAKALYQLSKDPNNCITMHDSGVVKPLLKMIGARDEELQEAAAGCVSNIRRLALANERARYG